jgi:Domain of unknown function DUF11
MSLQDLNEQLHSRDTHLDKARLSVHEEHTPEEITLEKQAFQKKEEWQSPKQEIYLISPDVRKARKKKIYIAIGSLVALLILGAAGFAGYTYLKRQSAVSVIIAGPASVASAERVSFDITYANNSWNEIENTKLTLVMPETFQLETTPEMKMTGKRAEIDLGSVAKGVGKTMTINGKFYGGKGEKGSIEASLRYTPKSTSSQFDVKTSFEVTLATSPLLFEVSAPSEIATGQELDYVITYENRSPETFRNLRVVAKYPQDFLYLSSDVAPTEGDNTWLIAELKPNQSGKIVIHGSLSGARDSAKTFEASIGILQGDNSLFTYNTIEKRTQIIATPLVITQLVNGNNDVVVNPGEELRYVVNYKNESGIGMRDVIISLSLDASFLDVASLKLPNGFYDQATSKITWKASDIPGLARLEPGQGGEIVFSVPVVKEFKPGTNPKNILIRSLATIDSPDVKTVLTGNKTIASNLIQVKVGALVNLRVAGLFSGDNIKNEGPVPPVVGSETTYTVRTLVASSSNDLSQARVTFVIPSGVVYKEKSSPSGETVEYNARTNELIWEVGILASGKEKEFQFQVAITPNASQVGKDVILVKQARFSAKESFTKKDVSTERLGITNYLVEDKNIPEVSGIVRAQ